MIKFNLNPLGEKVLGVLYAEKKKSALILPDGVIDSGSPQRFMKVVGIGTGDLVNGQFKVGDFFMVKQGTPIPFMPLGKDLEQTGIIEYHTILSKVEILEGDLEPVGMENKITPEEVAHLSKRPNEPN